MALNATLGHHEQNSLLTRARASLIAAERFESEAWTEATDSNKDAALIMGTNVLLSSFPIFGNRFLSQNRVRGNDDISILDDLPGTPFLVNFTPALNLPRSIYATGEEHIYWQGSITTASSATSFADSGMAGEYQADSFNYGSVLFLDGDLQNEIRTVTDFAANGTITTEAFTGTPAEGDSFVLIAPLPLGFYLATFETALAILDGKFDLRANMKRSGVASVSYGGGEAETLNNGQSNQMKGDMIPEMAARYIRPYVSRKAKVIIP